MTKKFTRFALVMGHDYAAARVYLANKQRDQVNIKKKEYIA
jgi:hypothetical protein